MNNRPFSRTTCYSLLTLAAFLSAGRVGSAAVTITEVANYSVTEMPGDADNFILFNAATGSDTQDLSDVSVNPYGNPRDNPGTTTIDTPTGQSVSSGIVWQYGGNGATVILTLGDNPDATYSDFNMFVLYNNISSSTTAYDDSAITLAEGAYPSTSDAYTVDDVTTAADAGEVVEFHITGAAAGEYFGMNAITAPESDDDQIGIGGVSFEVPEPSTWAMLMGGMLFLVGFLRWRRA